MKVRTEKFEKLEGHVQKSRNQINILIYKDHDLKHDRFLVLSCRLKQVLFMYFLC